MVTMPAGKYRLCDGLTRRTVLKIGGLALGGLSLPQLLRAESQSGRAGSRKSVIMIFLSGGPPHQDMFDLKPDAPAEIRGEFNPIATNVPGIEVCELLPMIAQRADRLAIVRSLIGSEGRHAAFQCLTGQPFIQQPPGGWPSLGAVVSKLKGPTVSGVPPFISLSPRMKGGGSGWADPGQAGFVGQAHAPFAPNAENASLELRDVTREKLTARQSLLNRLDRLKREVELSGALEGADSFYQQAFGILTSSRLADALNLEGEDPRVRERYGHGSNEPAGYGDAGPIMNEYFLTARRLIEAGARVVTLAYGRWDWHGRPHGTNFENARDHFPLFDQGLTALLDDLHERGMDRDVSVVVWGEFGRTPRINKHGGRDHWPQVACALLAGGGMRTGQIIGSTNPYAEHPKERPVHFQEVFATLYHNLGIDVNHATITDLSGRPQYLVDHSRYQPLPELV
jgi:Protein of unknown function (DUF1501)